jgi:hypothetical protein
MGDLARIVLLLLGGAGILTLAAGTVLSWTRPQRRVRRAVRRGVGAKPDAEIITAESGAGFSVETGLIAISWERGRWRMDYRLDELLGVEVLIDDAVAARVFRDEARLPLERIASEADNVSLRLLFEDPRHPDFEIKLWPPDAPAGKEFATTAAAIREANTWLARIESIVRRLARTAPVIRGGVPERSGASRDGGTDEAWVAED